MAALTESLNNTQEARELTTTPVDFSVSDFATIVKTTAFVDKTMMIRDVYNSSSRILITAPRRFGKSTNMDMLKRFFEIQVDVLGNPKAVDTTENYNLFKNNNLEICKNDKFFTEHFGKHPVVHIDCKPLGGASDYVNMLGAFRTIVKDSFSQHSYLLQASIIKPNLFSCITDFDANDFKKHLSKRLIKEVDDMDLINSFEYLFTLLYRHFQKKVFLLIDNYDVFVHNLLFRENTELEKKIIPFIESSIGNLLKNEVCVERVLITGVLPLIGEGFLYHENNIDCYHFLDNHPFTKYYGFTSDDLDKVLSKMIRCDEERNNVEKTIDNYYNAYVAQNQRIHVYNIWSVLKYVCRRTVQSYWCDRKYINRFRMYFKSQLIREAVEDLLQGYVTRVDISQPLTLTDVLKLNKGITSGAVEDKLEENELFFIFLYHTGYFSITRNLGRGVVSVAISSEEIRYELAKTVFEENSSIYNFKLEHLNGIKSAIEVFRPDSTDQHEDFLTFFENVKNYCGTYDAYFCRRKNLFMNLLTTVEYNAKVNINNPPFGATNILLKNKHQVAIVIMMVSNTAVKSHEDFTNKDLDKHIFDAYNNLRGKITITIRMDAYRKYEMAYSYYFKEGDTLKEMFHTRD